MNEWKDVVGFEGLYLVSCSGHVKSLDATIFYKDGRSRIQKGRMLKFGDNEGYSRVNLVKNGKVYPSLVHRLVAKAFIPNPRNYPFVNHKDFDRKNNSVENLEWCTPYQNHHYTIMHGRSINPNDAFLAKHGINSRRYNSVKVAQIFSNGNEIIWDSIREALLSLGKNKKDGSISKACKHGIRAYGYKWRYVL